MVVIDAVIRLVPGVLGDEESNRQDSFSGEERLLEFAQYTRPREYRGYEVPEVLLSGNHAADRPLARAAKRSQNADQRADLWANDSRNETNEHPSDTPG